MPAPKVSKNNVEQTINLEEEFGVSFEGAPQLRELIGQAIIDKIVNRTDSGDGMRFGKSGKGSSLKLKSPYSKQYADSDEFKAFGKSKGKVNMQLTGDMLGLMDIKRQDSNNITIGWTDGEQNKKAFNHIVGDTVPSRPFFGVNKRELSEIKSQFKSEIKEALKLKQDEGRSAFNDFVLNLIKNIKDDSGES